jgi:hypothetical protein
LKDDSVATIEIAFLLISALGATTGFIAIYGVVMRRPWMDAFLKKAPIHPRIRSITVNRLYAVLFGFLFIIFFSSMFFVVLMESLGIDIRIH